MDAYRNASYLGFVLYFIGIVLFLYGFYHLSIEKDLDAKGIKTTGEVYALTAPWWPVILGVIVTFVGYILRKIMKRKAIALDSQTR